MQGVVILLVLLGLAYGAGYYTRELISRRRRERARLWKNYTEPAWLQPANANQPRPRLAHGDLGQMLYRWEDRTRARRVAQRKPPEKVAQGFRNVEVQESTVAK